MMIRDAILITNAVGGGDLVAFNQSQVSLLMLVLSHFACDAHVPVHCDRRDLNKPSKVHSDLETFWEEEILRCHGFSEEREQFDLDENGRVLPNSTTRSTRHPCSTWWINSSRRVPGQTPR